MQALSFIPGASTVSPRVVLEGKAMLLVHRSNLMTFDPPNMPSRVLPADIRMQSETTDGFKAGIVIDMQSHSSPLQLGLDWIQPGTDVVSWETDAGTHEVYYLQQGSVRIRWNEPDTGDAEVSAGESFYFPPGRRYSLENIGDEEAFIIWSAVSSPT